MVAVVDVVGLVGLVVLVDVVGGGVATPVVKLQPERGGVNDVGLLDGGAVVGTFGVDVVVVGSVVTEVVVVVGPDDMEVVVIASVVDVVDVECEGAGDAADKSMARKRKPPKATTSTKKARTTRSGHLRGRERFLSSRVIPKSPYVSTWPRNSPRRGT